MLKRAVSAPLTGSPNSNPSSRYCVSPERAAAEQEKPFLAYFDFVVSRRKIADGKTPGTVGFRSIGAPAGVFQLDLRGADRDPVFVQHNTCALSRGSSENSCGKKTADGSQDHNECANQSHPAPL